MRKKKEEGNEVSKKDKDDDDLPLFEKIKMLKKEVYLVKVFLEQKKKSKALPRNVGKVDITKGRTPNKRSKRKASLE